MGSSEVLAVAGAVTPRRLLLSGNEAVARGAREAGVRVATGLSRHAEHGDPRVAGAPRSRDARCTSSGSTNEKVALDVALGAALGGRRALCTMKHVGLNVAADTFMTSAYTGVRAGLVIVSADDPGMH